MHLYWRKQTTLQNIQNANKLYENQTKKKQFSKWFNCSLWVILPTNKTHIISRKNKMVPETFYRNPYFPLISFPFLKFVDSFERFRLIFQVGRQ